MMPRSAIATGVADFVENMLTVVQSMAGQTLRTLKDPQRFVEAFQQRVQALGRAHSVLTRERWRGTGLRELADAGLEGFANGGAKLRIEGPDLRLTPNAAVSISLALHELATNALKYGALSVPGGTVRLSWELDGEPGSEEEVLRVTWIEQDGPKVAPPTHTGFGQRMLEKGVAHELGGEIAVDYAPTGFVCRMSLPANRTLRHDG